MDITRRHGSHLTLGAGIHVCVGRIMARLEAQLLLEALALRIATIALAGPVERQLNNTLRGLDGLPLRVQAA